MSQMKRVLDVVQDLRSLADSIAALAGATSLTGAVADASLEGNPEAGTATAAQEAPESPAQFTESTGATRPDEGHTGAVRPAREAELPEPTEGTREASRTTNQMLSVVELRAYVAERSTPENRPKIRAILGRYGVDKLTDLAEEHYPALIAEVDAL